MTEQRIKELEEYIKKLEAKNGALYALIEARDRVEKTPSPQQI